MHITPSECACFRCFCWVILRVGTGKRKPQGVPSLPQYAWILPRPVKINSMNDFSFVIKKELRVSFKRRAGRVKLSLTPIKGYDLHATRPVLVFNADASSICYVNEYSLWIIRYQNIRLK